LLCAIINAVDKRQLTFSSDPIGSDGIVGLLGALTCRFSVPATFRSRAP
jgi:hypothetical protein